MEGILAVTEVKGGEMRNACYRCFKKASIVPLCNVFPCQIWRRERALYILEKRSNG